MSPRIVTPTLAVLVALLVLSPPGQAARKLVLPKKSVGAKQLKTKSVGTKQLKNKAVTSLKVADGSLLLKDFKASQRASLIGNTGSRGPAGPKGPTGSQGPQGPSGTHGVLSISGTWSAVKVPGNQGNSVITPANCRTVAHTATAGETAVLNVSATASPSAAENNVLYLVPQISTDTGPFTKLAGAVTSATTLSVGTAHVTSQVVVPLTAGTMYRFAAGFASNSEVTISAGFCQGTVMIVKAG